MAIPNPCWSNPCLNGGTCEIKGADAYLCLCPDDKHGKHCDYNLYGDAYIQKDEQISAVVLDGEGDYFTVCQIELQYCHFIQCPGTDRKSI